MIIAVCFLLFLSGCGGISIKREFSSIQNKIQGVTGTEIFLKQADELLECNDVVEPRISRNDAISIALNNNPHLQAEFESLGISKADLVQAGLFTNPNAYVNTWPPIKGASAGMETGITFAVQDFWQVPLKKNIARDVLEETALRIQELVLDTVAQTRKAYDHAIIVRDKLALTQKILKETDKLRAEIYSREPFGFSSELDKSFADITVGNLQQSVIQLTTELDEAFIELRKVMGKKPVASSLPLMECSVDYLEKCKNHLPLINALEDMSLQQRPELQRAQIKIQQAEDQLALERANVFQNVNFGVGYKKEFTGEFGVGPLINVDLPIFDSNYAHIARAKFVVEQAKKELHATKLDIIAQVHKAYSTLSGALEKMFAYNTMILIPNKHALSYTQDFEKVMQITTVVVFQTRITLNENVVKFETLKQEAWDALTDLERAVGKRLDFDYFDSHIH